MIKQGEKYKAMCSAKKQAFRAGKEKKNRKTESKFKGWQRNKSY